MKISEIMKGVSIEEQNRRMEAVEKMNKLWNKKQVCEDKTEIKRIEKKISQIARQEQFWMKNVAFFLY
jgi:hypothetical protein